MAFPLINTWSVGDLLTSAQMNAVTADLVKALDKTGDGISSSPAGGISGTVDVLSTGSIRTLGNSNLVGVKSTSSGTTSGLEVTSAGYITLDADSQVYSNGTINAQNGSNLIFASGATLQTNAGALVTLNADTTHGGILTLNGALKINKALNLGQTSTSASSYTMVSTDNTILVDTSSNSVTITLQSPGSTTTGRVVCFLNDSVGASHTLTIGTPGGGIWVNGSVLSSHSFAADTVVKFGLYNDGTNWRFLYYIAGI